MSTNERVEALCAPHVDKVGGVISALRLLMESLGAITPGVIESVAHIFNLSQAEVRGVVSFYDDFRTTPRGELVVRICQAEACQAVGARELTQTLTTELGLAMDETRGDGSMTLEGVYCLGLCACGPAMMVNGSLYGAVDAARAKDIIRSHRAVELS
ncbi:MAG: NAD(P)H-dependent oxidoreductase subunit E [Pseudomonadales bacterium]